MFINFVSFAVFLTNLRYFALLPGVSCEWPLHNRIRTVCNVLFIFGMRDLVGLFLVIWLVQLPVMWLVGAIKHINPLLGLRTKEEAAMHLIYILQNDTIIELATSCLLWRHRWMRLYTNLINRTLALEGWFEKPKNRLFGKI